MMYVARMPENHLPW